MQKTNMTLLSEIQRLASENKKLQRQLRGVRKSFDAIKSGNVDALVIGKDHDRKIFTEATSDKIYRVLIEKMNEGAITVNVDGTILYCNSRFANMVNLPMEKILGKKLKKFIGSPSIESVEHLLRQGKRAQVKEEVYLNVKNAPAMPILFSVNSFLLDEDRVTSIVLTDLTSQYKFKTDLLERTIQLERINLELECANKDLTSFTYVSSHDLQEPLRKIQNFVGCITLDEEKNLSDSGKHYLARMGQSAKRMQELINDLLTYSQTKSSERTFELTNMNILIEDLKKEYEDPILAKALIIEAEDLCAVSIIRFQFRQLFQNLVSNSIKFAKPNAKPHIIIRSEKMDGIKLGNDKLSPAVSYCHISYTDNGIGFDPRFKDHIFDVFKRLHNKEDYEGTGIGLAICKRVVENHNGIITATGELNKGARFDIYIPSTS